MKSIRILIALLIVLVIGAIALNSDAITLYFLEALQFSWTMSNLLPRVFVIMSTAAILILLLPLLNLSKLTKAVVGFLISAICIGGYLSINLPYIDDWVRGGESLKGKLEGNQIELYLNSAQPNYDGLVFMALPNCPYCFQAFPKLEMLKHRDPNLDVSVFVSARDSAGLNFFNEHIGSTTIPVYLIDDRDQATALSNGKFPTFLYFKEGKVVYRWSNNQFGNPALDWVENRLN
ncbi:MAG: hypothetical protein H6601_03380 [Flavobacteriales bacterium]|nr:hypothetical protein [Flavobacteriales bacterium]